MGICIIIAVLVIIGVLIGYALIEDCNIKKELNKEYEITKNDCEFFISYGEYLLEDTLIPASDKVFIKYSIRAFKKIKGEIK